MTFNPKGICQCDMFAEIFLCFYHFDGKKPYTLENAIPIHEIKVYSTLLLKGLWEVLHLGQARTYVLDLHLM